MGKRLVFNIISSIIGLYVASYLIKDFEVTSGMKGLLIGGLLLGLANFLIKPILKLITLPLRILTLGLFGFLIDMFLVWSIIDVVLWQYMEINGLIALFWITLITWAANLVFLRFAK